MRHILLPIPPVETSLQAYGFPDVCALLKKRCVIILVSWGVLGDIEGISLCMP